MGQEPIGFTPGSEDLFGGDIAEHGLDSAEQRFANMGIMFGEDLQADMLLRNRRPSTP